MDKRLESDLRHQIKMENEAAKQYRQQWNQSEKDIASLKESYETRIENIKSGAEETIVSLEAELAAANNRVSELEAENARLRGFVTKVANDRDDTVSPGTKAQAQALLDTTPTPPEPEARLQEIAETERQNATTAEAQAGKWKVAYENARAREDQYFQWVSDLCDHVDNDIVMQITGISMPRNTTPPEPEARYVITEARAWNSGWQCFGIVDTQTEKWLQRDKVSWDTNSFAWLVLPSEKDEMFLLQARADELNASDS